jgi:hypothetical protein
MENKIKYLIVKYIGLFVLLIILLYMITPAGLLRSQGYYFADDFETDLRGQDPGWSHKTNTYNSIFRTDKTSFSGDHCLNIHVTSPKDNSTMYKSNPVYSPFRKHIFVRLYFKIGQSYNMPNKWDHQHVFGFNINNVSGDYLDLGLNRTTDPLDSAKFAFDCPWKRPDGSYGGGTGYKGVPDDPRYFMDKNKWYCLEVEYKSDPVDGGIRQWINGILVKEFWGKDTHGQEVSLVWFGSCIKYQGIEGDLYIDDVIISDSYIGPGSITPHHVLRINTFGSGIVTLNPAGSIYRQGTYVTLTALPTQGWMFSHWDHDLSGSNNPTTINMDTVKNVTAIFKVREEEGLFDFTPVDDSYIRGGEYSDNNYDLNSVLRVKHGDDDKYMRHTYLKFDLTGLNDSIKSAELKLTVRQLPNGSPSAAFVYSVDDDNWTEDSLSWNNAPAAGSLLDSRIDIDKPDDVYNWDVTSFVASEMSGDKVVSFMLRDDSKVNKTVDFFRREDNHPPVLTIMTDTDKTKLISDIITISDMYQVDQNFPNPFNPKTNIRYVLHKPVYTRLSIYDIRGRLIAVLIDKFQKAGIYNIHWTAIDSEGQKLPSGIYFCSFEAGSFIKTIKIIMMQ